MATGKSITGMLGALVFGGIFAVVGLAVAFFVGKPTLDKAKASEKWPSVEGVVVSSDVVTKRGDDRTMYAADVVYGYSVDGRDYKCSTVSFGGDYSSSNSSHAYSVTNKYRAGSKVQAFYNPDEPNIAALEPGATWMSYFALGFGLIFLVVGLLICSVPLFYLGVGAITLGGAATGMIGRVGNSTARQARSASAAGSSSVMPNPQSAAPPIQDAFDIK